MAFITEREITMVFFWVRGYYGEKDNKIVYILAKEDKKSEGDIRLVPSELQARHLKYGKQNMN